MAGLSGGGGVVGVQLRLSRGQTPAHVIITGACGGRRGEAARGHWRVVTGSRGWHWIGMCMRAQDLGRA